MPTRIRLSRARGWKKPPGAIVVSRPSRFGNPFPAAGDIPAAVAKYRRWIAGELDIGKPPPTRQEIRGALRGHDLACWCPLDGPCHADVLIEIANG